MANPIGRAEWNLRAPWMRYVGSLNAESEGQIIQTWKGDGNNRLLEVFWQHVEGTAHQLSKRKAAIFSPELMNDDEVCLLRPVSAPNWSALANCWPSNEFYDWH